MKLRVEGLRDLERNLKNIEKRGTQKAVLRRALKKAAEPMRKAAETNAPVDTGELEGSIKLGTKVVNEVGRSAYAATMKAGGTKSEAVGAMRAARRAAKASGATSFVELFMGPTKEAFHAKFVEFGTRHMAPDPFMRPAFDAEAENTIHRLGPILMAEIEKSIRRISARG
ncbi:HK97-gp10 family putative phage morphogenesis protein [Thioclava kandeliae]|uniref:HK97-gp10 family putative phage morphogenesis protein n=1 Tax=Thioclava kandeliae TaxID=3070818 RepID=A0ABV1SG19_9RHOB